MAKSKSWGAKPKQDEERPLRYRWTRRIVLTIALVGMSIWLGQLLLRPFWHPRLHLVLVTGDAFSTGDQVLAAPRSDYVVEDFAGLLSLAPVVHQSSASSGPLILGNLRSRDDMQRLDDELSKLVTGHRDVFVVYVSAQGISSDGEAFLACSEADAQNPLAGQYRVRNLLAQLSELQSHAILLILDAGQTDYDPARGMLVNQFPRLLRDEVQRSGSKNLWVLSSHGPGERSHISHALRRSIFSYFVEHGMAGAADSSGDRVVDLNELFRYVSISTAAFVEQTTAGNAAQAPQLMWGGGEIDAAALSLEITAVLPPNSERPVLTPQLELTQLREPSAIETSAKRQAENEVRSYVQQQISRFSPRGQLGYIVTDRARSVLVQGGKIPTLPGVTPTGTPAATDPAKPGETKPGDKPAEGDAKKPDAAAGDKPAGDQAAGDKAGDKPAAEPTGTATAGAETKGGDTAADGPAIDLLLAKGWQVRDALLAESLGRARGVDSLPHIWRVLERRLLAYELRHRRGANAGEKVLRQNVTELVGVLEQLQARVAGDQFPARSLGRRIALSYPGLSAPITQVRHLAVLERIAAEGGEAMPAVAAAALTQLDYFTSRGGEADFLEWAKAIPPEAMPYEEVRFTSEIAAMQGFDWTIAQQLLRNRLEAERIAAMSSRYEDWIGKLVQETDLKRRHLEREVLAGLAPNRNDLLERLAALQADLVQLRTNLNLLEDAHRLEVEMLHHLPEYLSWQASRDGATLKEQSSSTEISALVDSLIDLVELRQLPDPTKLPTLARLLPIVKQNRDTVHDYFSDDRIERLVAIPATPGDAWEIELLLETTLPSAGGRQLLLDACGIVDAELASGVTLPDVTRVSLPTSAGRLPATEVHRRGELAWKMLRLLHPDNKEEFPELSSLEAAWKMIPPVERTREDISEFAVAVDQFSEELASFYRNLPGVIEQRAAAGQDFRQVADRKARIRELAMIERGCYFVDSRDAAVMADPSPSLLLGRVDAYDLFSWQRTRLELAMVDAPPSDLQTLSDKMLRYQAAAEAIPLQPPLDSRLTLPLEVVGPTSVRLALENQKEAFLNVTWNGEGEQRAWVTAEYADDLLKIETPATQPIYPSNYSDTDLLLQRPTFKLRRGVSETLRMVVRRQEASTRPSRVILRFHVAGKLLRYDVAVDLPLPESVDLLVDGVPGSFANDSAGAQLFPFPNRSTNYQLSLASSATIERQIAVEMYSLKSSIKDPLPQVALSDADAKKLFSELPVGPKIADLPNVALPPAGQNLPIPFPAPPPPPKPLKPGEVPEPPPPPDPKLGTLYTPQAMVGGVLVLIREPAAGRTIMKRLEVTAQRPQRYVRPRVNYQPGRQRIEIIVDAEDPRLLPAGGSRVHVEVLDPIPSEAERRLDGQILAPNFETQLFVEVADEPGRYVNIAITVDDYPRAFLYRVPCSAIALDVPEDTDAVKVSLDPLPKGTLYKAPAGEIPVVVRVDAPGSSGGNPPLEVRVGVDRDRDRTLNDEAALLLTSTRDVKFTASAAAPLGEFTIDTIVSDFSINVPESGLQSGLANMLAQVSLGDRMGYSNPIEIVIDGEAPRISGVELLPSQLAVIGKPVAVSCIASDDELSGVAKLEVMFDTNRSGAIGDDDKPVIAVFQPEGRWTATVPTEGLMRGTYNLLLRATDRVGNQSPISRVKVQVVSPEEAGTGEKKLLGTITGTVIHGVTPQPGMKVSLWPEGANPYAKVDPKNPEPSKKITEVATGPKGTYEITRVPPGKYLLVGEGLVKNKNRRVAIPVTVEPPKPLPPIELKLP